MLGMLMMSSSLRMELRCWRMTDFFCLKPRNDYTSFMFKVNIMLREWIRITFAKFILKMGLEIMTCRINKN